MATVDERGLWQRLQRVQALHDGATTPGEREAAARALQRLARRLEALRADDPVARFVAGDVRRLSIARPPEPPGEDLPDERSMASMLAAWEQGTVGDRQVQRWAERFVAGVDLPSHPDDEGACRAEVLLQLAMLDRVPLTRADVPVLRRFLRTRDWAAWFARLAEVCALAS